MRALLPTSRQAKAQSLSVPPPVGGWNARDPWARMSEKDAIYLENWIPRANCLELRKGCIKTGTLPAHVPVSSPHDIRTLMPYNSVAGAKKLFAACEDGIYDVSNALSDTDHAFNTPLLALSGANTYWQHLNVSTAGGNFLFACNGSQSPILYNGTTVTQLTGVSTPSLTGPADVTKLINVSLFKGRMIFTLKDSLSFWYGAVNAVAGALTEFPLAVLFRKGGYLMATARWTLDSGAGPEDRFVAITSEGEVAVYQGYDPSSASNWSLVGIFELARPLGRRCFCQIGGDLAVLTENGLISLAKALPSATPTRTAALSDKISSAFQDFVTLAGTMPGWVMADMPNEGLLFVNVPAPDGTFSQIVLNTLTGAWTRFTGWNSTTLCLCDGKLYFASKNLIYHGLTGTTDAGNAVNLKAKTAFLGQSSRIRQKHVSLMRLNLTSNATVSFKMGLDTDYDSAEFGQSLVTIGSGAALWDSAIWDQAKWDLDTVQAKWRSIAHKPGDVLSLRLSAQLKYINLTWNAVDFMVLAGGLL